MRLIAFRYGKTEITGRMAFQNGDENIKIPIGLLFFLIEEDDRKILVDVGCETMPGFELFEFEEPVKVLEAYGIKGSEITDILITHGHHDHIDAVHNYPEATVHIHQKEYESAKRYLGNSNNVCIFDKDKKISDNIQIKYVGGHSHGSCVVHACAGEKTFVLCGDECYTKENIEKNIPTGCSVALEQSQKFIDEFKNETYIPVVFHDLELVTQTGFRVLHEG